MVHVSDTGLDGELGVTYGFGNDAVTPVVRKSWGRLKTMYH